MGLTRQPLTYPDGLEDGNSPELPPAADGHGIISCPAIAWYRSFPGTEIQLYCLHLPLSRGSPTSWFSLRCLGWTQDCTSTQQPPPELTRTPGYLEAMLVNTGVFRIHLLVVPPSSARIIKTPVTLNSDFMTINCGLGQEQAGR